MKRRLRALSTKSVFPNRAYKNLYHEVEKFLNKANPCRISNGKCARGKDGGRNFCCGSTNSNGQGACSHCGKNGCTADRPLACRLWLCHTAEKNLSKAQLEKLNNFRKLAGFFGNENIMFRATRQDAKKILLKRKMEKNDRR